MMAVLHALPASARRSDPPGVFMGEQRHTHTRKRLPSVAHQVSGQFTSEINDLVAICGTGRGTRRDTTSCAKNRLVPDIHGQAVPVSCLFRPQALCLALSDEQGSPAAGDCIKNVVTCCTGKALDGRLVTVVGQQSLTLRTAICFLLAGEDRHVTVHAAERELRVRLADDVSQGWLLSE